MATSKNAKGPSMIETFQEFKETKKRSLPRREPGQASASAVAQCRATRRHNEFWEYIAPESGDNLDSGDTFFMVCRLCQRKERSKSKQWIRQIKQADNQWNDGMTTKRRRNDGWFNGQIDPAFLSVYFFFTILQTCKNGKQAVYYRKDI